MRFKITLATLVIILLASCSTSAPDSPREAALSDATNVSKLALANVYVLGALNRAGKLTPAQWDRALNASNQVGVAAAAIAANPGHELTPVWQADVDAGSAELLAIAKEASSAN